MSLELEGKCFVVTGAAGAIGRECAGQLLAGGARVLMVDVDQSRLEAATRGLPQYEGMSTYVSRIGSPAEAADVLDAAEMEIDGLVHMAGIFEPDPLDPDDRTVFDRAMSSNLTNAYDLCVAYQSRRNPRSVGRIVLCSSGSFRRGTPGRVAYSVAKAGIVGLVRSLSKQFAPHILVNAVAPNAIRTPMTEAIIREQEEAILATITLGRFGEPEEVAHVTLSLVLPAASYITGAVIPVDGGLMARNA